jgi:glycosyltransferase involved in cell wall biosynthesis
MNSFTVLMPTYNRHDLYVLFDKAIDSCLSNTILPNEIIVVVDGPVSVDFEIKIRGYDSHDLIKIIWLPENIGISRALNEGLKAVKTKYVFRADGDDINRRNRFSIQLDMLSSGLQLVGGAIIERDINGTQLAVKRCPRTHEEILRYGKRRNPFNHMTVAFDYKAAMSVGGYPDVHLLEDWALWVLMLEGGVIAGNSDEILVDATADLNMYRRRGGLKTILSEYVMQGLLVRHLKKTRLSAFFDFIGKSIILAAPAAVRGFIYREYLRDSK